MKLQIYIMALSAYARIIMSIKIVRHDIVYHQYHNAFLHSSIF